MIETAKIKTKSPVNEVKPLTNLDSFSKRTVDNLSTKNINKKVNKDLELFNKYPLTSL